MAGSHFSGWTKYAYLLFPLNKLPVLNHAKYTAQCRSQMKIVAIPSLQDNYIWLIYSEKKKLGYIVDPGTAQPVLDMCSQLKIKLIGILLTHHHPDHTGGVGAIVADHNMQEQTHMPVYGPACENIAEVTCALSDNESITLATEKFDVLSIPGHTRGHIAYFSRNLMNNPVLFAGDTLFSSGCGRLFEGTAEIMHQSLMRISHLPDDTLIFCAHEYTENNLKFAITVEPDNPALYQRQQEVLRLRQANQPTIPTTLEQEKKFNPFLRTDQPDVIKAASSYAGYALQTPVDVFAALRQWKDNF